MNHATNQPRPYVEWSLQELAHLEELLVGVFGDPGENTYRRDYDTQNLADWLDCHRSGISDALDEAGVPYVLSDWGHRYRRLGLRVVEGEAS